MDVRKKRVGNRILMFWVAFALALGLVTGLKKSKKEGGDLDSSNDLISSFSFLKPKVDRIQIAQALAEDARFDHYPSEAMIPMDSAGDRKMKTLVTYSIDTKLQAAMESQFRSYEPDYGAFVAMDPKTGRILSIISFRRGESKDGKDRAENLALKSTFPSASVFKLVTAAAAIELKKYSSYTVIPFNGRSHTLYRNNVFTDKINRYTRFPTLREAFAMSINTVFAKIGAFSVGPTQLQAYADRFGFNRKIASDLPIQQGHAPIPNDSWGVAEAASGFTTETTMSPLQGAMMAAAVVNNGRMMEPYVVDSLADETGSVVYRAAPQVATKGIEDATAYEIRKLMGETISRGTSHKSFRNFFKGKFANLEVGGKTGSLTGNDPQGKYDWFVGFARDPQGSPKSRSIAVAALTIHQKTWRVKSSFLARKAFEKFFENRP